jgi:hypothetical protein
MDKIDHTDIVFENCDFCTIPSDKGRMLEFNLIGVTDSAMSVNLNEEFYSLKVAREVYLEFSKDALKILSHWSELDDFIKNNLENHINFRDITSIYIYYGDNKSTQFHVPYQEENETELGSPNIYQVNEFLPNGNCRVEIKKN